MSKFCTNCGAALDDNAAFCVTCGAAQATPEAPVYAEPAAPAYAEPAAPAAKKPNKGLIIGLIAGAVVLAVVLAFFIFGGSKPTDPLDTYIDIIYNGKFDKMKDMAPQEYWDWYEDEYDQTIDDIIEEAEDEYDDMMDSMEDKYGKNIKITYEVTKEKDLSEKKLEKIAEALEDKYDIDASKVSEGKEIKYDVTITGDEDDDTNDDLEMTVIKYNGKWYKINYYEYSDELYVYFSIG